MTDTPSGPAIRTSRGARTINASREAVYRALTDPKALVVWRAPGDMTARMHRFDLRVGGGYSMSLFYSPEEESMRGKTADREDRFTARYVELLPPSRVVEAITFESDDDSFSGEMVMTATLDAKDNQTVVTLEFENLPAGVRPEDNDAGTRSSLEKLARLLEQD